AHHTGLDPPSQGFAATGVTGPDAGLEAVLRIVGEADALLGVGDLHDRERRTEGLLGHALHRVVDVNEHGWLVEAARTRAGVTAGEDLGPLGDRVAHVLIHDLELGREDHGPHVDRPDAGRHALTQPTDVLGHLGHEVVVDRRIDIAALDRDTNLAGVVHGPVDSGVGGPLDVGVVADDHRVLAT